MKLRRGEIDFTDFNIYYGQHINKILSCENNIQIMNIGDFFSEIKELKENYEKEFERKK